MWLILDMPIGAETNGTSDNFRVVEDMKEMFH